jgi:hypothetical protein
MKIFTQIGLIFFLLLFGGVNSNAQKLIQTFEEPNNTGGNSGLGMYIGMIGDVNNDGYDDIALTGRENYYPTSRVMIYFGGSEMDDTPDVILEGIDPDDSFGDAIEAAGDINNDGYDDVIVGSDNYNSNSGRAYVFYGGAEMDGVPDVIMSGEGPDHYFGSKVSGAGDINNDGYADVMVGAYAYNSNTGRVYVYYGGAAMDNTPDLVLTGENPSDSFGGDLSDAGDVNKDGYDDFIISSRGYNSSSGRVYVYHGGSTVDSTPDLIIDGQSQGGTFGITISDAGDVNKDGYDDILIGGRSYYSDRRTFVYHGGESMDANYDEVLLEDNAVRENYKRMIVRGAGDLNNDGFDDVVSFYFAREADVIRIYVYYGRENMHNYPDFYMSDNSKYDGFALTAGGDYNGDGYDDVLFGHGSWDTYHGRVLLYCGGSSMDNVADFIFLGEGRDNTFGSAVTKAGDVNNDGYEDILVGAKSYNNNTGRAYIYFGGLDMDNTPDVVMTGSEGVNTYFGTSVAGIGDVNNDGYDDVMIGGNGYVSNKGRAYIFFGGPDMDNTPDVVMTGEDVGNQFGYSVSGAGDVNKDGFDDVIVGAFGYNTRGRAYIYHGGTSMDNTPDLIMNTAISNNNFGMNVSGAGDVNKDGFADVIIGSLNGTELYYGGSSMDNISDVTIVEGKASEFGNALSAAGDVNKDGFDDIAVGDYSYNTSWGRVYIFYGGNAMDNIADVTMTGTSLDNYMGESISGAGDINNDGFDDIVVTERADFGRKERVHFFYGGAPMDNIIDITINEEERIIDSGNAIAIVGDVNKDGYDEVLLGDFEVPHNGKAFLYTVSPLPVVNTKSIASVTDNSATVTGSILELGDTQPTAHGFCWNTDPSPTISNDIQDKGARAATGEFTGNITGLTGGTTYYIRAYATNDGGTNYGEELSFTTLKSDQTISFNALSAVTYGDASFSLTATASSGLAVTYSSSDPSVATISGNNITIVGAGTTTITATQEGSEIYKAAPQVHQVLTVNKASLTITADDKSKVYGAVNPVLSISFSDFVNGEDDTALNTQPSVTTTADASSGVGSVPIAVSGAASDNYSFNYVNGILSIKKAELTVTADDKSKTYGDANPPFTFRYTGFVNGEDKTVLNTEPAASSIADVSTGVGSAAITLSGGVDDNYSFSYVDGTLSINKAELTATADDKNKTYGEINPELTVNYSGFVNGDDKTALTTNPTAQCSADVTTGVGAYLITASGGVDENYSFRYVNGTLNIGKAELTITADDKSKTYGEINPALTFSYSGFVNGQGESALKNTPAASSSADANTGAGSSEITTSGGEADNYSFKYVSGTLNIGKKELAVTADDKSKTYGDANPAFTLSYAGFVNGDDATDLTTTPSASSSADENTGAGSAVITVSGGSDDNYTFSYVDGSLSINKAELTLTADDKNKTYGEVNPELTVSYSGFVNGEDATVLTTNPTAQCSANATTGVGSAPITLTGAAAENYSFKYVNGTLNIGKTELTVTADDKSKTYGDTNPAFTFTYSGFVNSEDATVLSTEPTANSTAVASTAAGSVAITVAGGVADNYSFKYVDGTLDITKAALTVTADDMNKAYGEANPEFTASYSGFVNGDNAQSLTKEPTFTTTANVSTIPGSASIVVSGAQSGNYTFTYVDGTLTINKAELTVTADDKVKLYGEANPVFTLGYTGFVNGEDASSLTSQPTASSSANESTAVGSSPIIPSGGTADKYSFKYVGGTLSINKAELTVTADDKSKTYGEANPAFTLSYTGFVNGDDASDLTTAPTASSIANAGTGAGSIAIAASGGADDNYSFKYVDGSLSISKAELIVTADDKSKVYGEANPAFTLTYSGFVNADDVSDLTTVPTASSNANETTGAGSKQILASGGDDENYSFKYVDGTLNITKAALTITADDKSKTYGEANPELTVSYTGFVNGDNSNSLIREATPATVADANTEPGSVAIAVSGAQSDNYTFTYQNGTLSINKAELTVTADDKVKLYGEGNPEFTYSYSGFVNGEDASALTSLPTAGSTADVSTGAGAASIVVSGGTSDKYNFQYVNGELLINKAILTVVAEDKTKVYGEINPEFTSRYVGFVNGDQLADLTSEPKASSVANAETHVGKVDIIVTGGEDDNYNFTYVTGTLEITRAPLTIRADDKSKAYGEENPEFTASYTGFVNGDQVMHLIKEPTLTSAADVNTTVGTAAIVVSGGISDNYELSYVNGTLSIGKAELTVSALNKDKNYGDANPAFTLSYSGFVNGDDVSTLTSQPTASSTANAGTGAGEAAIVVSGGSSDLYDFKYQNGTLSINKAILNVSTDDITRNYGENNPEFKLKYIGFVNGDDASALSQEPVATCAANSTTEVSGVEIIISGGTADNYKFDYEKAMLLINPAELYVSVDNKTRAYGEANPEFTLSYTGFVNGDEESVLDIKPACTTKANETTGVGNVDIIVSGGSDSNYNFNHSNGTLTINKAELTLTADDKTITYGDAIPELTVSYTGFVNEESASVLTSQPVLESNADENSNAGTEVITVSGGTADNYSLKHVNGTLSINKAELTVSADDKSKTYGESNPEFSLSYNGFVKGEDASVLTTAPTVSSNADESTDAGTEAITVSGGAADNYSFKYMPGSLSIGKANLTVTADNLSREQGKENPELTFSFSGFVNGDSESDIDVLPVASCLADETSTPGEYDIIIDSGEDNNYEFTYENGLLTVTLVTGISDIELTELVAYPNPTKEWVAIKWTSNKTYKAEIQILSMNGSLVKAIKDYSKGSKINISELRPGTYLVRIKIEDNYQIKKIIKS